MIRYEATNANKISIPFANLPQLYEHLKSFRTIDGKTSEERRYYITSHLPIAGKIARATRSHWSIENKVHWILDVDFNEDLSQISTGHAAENFSILKRLTINVLTLDLAAIKKF